MFRSTNKEIMATEIGKSSKEKKKTKIKDTTSSADSRYYR